MNCEDFELYESAYIDNMLSSEEKLEFESHINRCEYCNVKLQNLKIIVESANEIEEVDLPINFSSELKTKLEKEKKFKSKNVMSNKKRMLSAIVAGLLIIITSVSLINNSSIYKKRNNLHSEIDQMSENQEKVTFDIASEKSTEALDGIEKENSAQPRIMSIDNIEANEELAIKENIEETNDENNYNIMTAKNNENSLENEDFQNQPIKKNYNKTINLFVLVSLIVSVVILIYKRFKK